MRDKFKSILEILKDRFERPLIIRIILVGVFFAVLFLIIINKLYVLQVLNGDKYTKDFINRIERTVKTAGTRGNIYDVNGNLLAYNKLSYNVVISDDGSYTDYNDRNLMLYKLAAILEKHDAAISSRFEIDIDSAGNYYFTSSSESARKRFLASVYNCKTSELDMAEKDGTISNSTDVTAADIVEKKANDYAFTSIKDENSNPVVPNNETLLDMIKILFTLRQTAFQRYETSTISYDISEECMAELLENQGELKGTNVEESYIRRYNNAKYFSHIIGYTGAIQDEDTLKELQKTYSDYDISDLVGATGIEKTMEQELHGIKGERDIYVDSNGQVLQTISETAPSAGNDIYLSIDQNLQIGVYHLLEYQLAGIIANKIVNVPASEITTPARASDIVISSDTAFFQFINNNILDTSHFFDTENRGKAEKQIAEAFTNHKSEVIDNIDSMLRDTNARPLSELSNEYVAYMAYILEFLSKSDVGIVDSSKIDNFSESYLAWKNDSISLRDYLYSGISEGWVTASASLNNDIDATYQDAEIIYNNICDYVIKHIQNESDLDKLIYKYMLFDKNGLSGRLLSMALYEQGVLEYSDELYNALDAGDENYAYQFLIERIKSIDITPAQMALDPCMGSVVITDVNTGDVKALVVYPGYDNNRINDSSYFSQCLNDQSLPLINSATQTNKAPGSTLKPLTAAAVLEEGAIGLNDLVNCTGRYTEVTPNINCWIGIPGHHELTVSGAIENSCNFCFADYGHRLSMTTDETTGEQIYSTTTGIEKLRKYESMFGLDRKSGIQIDEKEPQMSDSDPERSAFGQGTNSFNNVQLARYTTALATGKLFNLTILNKETDCNGNLIQEFPAEQIDTINLSDSTWEAVHTGLRSVITTGVAKSVFQNWDTVEIAGKTGTAEEVKTRGNHGEFISYAPYDNPEIACTVVMPFSYSSGNSARLARRVYDYYYGATDLPSIINSDAHGISITNVVDA